MIRAIIMLMLLTACSHTHSATVWNLVHVGTNHASWRIKETPTVIYVNYCPGGITQHAYYLVELARDTGKRIEIHAVEPRSSCIVMMEYAIKRDVPYCVSGEATLYYHQTNLGNGTWQHMPWKYRHEVNEWVNANGGFRAGRRLIDYTAMPRDVVKRFYEVCDA